MNKPHITYSAYRGWSVRWPDGKAYFGFNTLFECLDYIKGRKKYETD